MSVLDRVAHLTPEQRAVFELLRRKQEARKQRKPPQPPAITPVAPAEHYPLSLDQERLWFLYHLDPKSNAYNIDAAVRMRGKLDVPALKRSLDEVVRRHEIWRTTFPSVDGRPVQRIGEPWQVPLPLIDMSQLARHLSYQDVAKVALGEARRKFDLIHGPLVRAALVRLGKEDHLCLLTVHHIVTDWYSFHVFWAELAALYKADLAGETKALPAPPIRYVDFSTWQRQWMQGEVLDQFVDFWVEQLEGWPQVLELPTDRPRPTYYTSVGSKVPLDLDRQRVDGLKALSGQESASLFMTLIALYGLTLGRHAGQERVLISSPSANRRFAELEPMIGFFLTQFLYGVDATGDPTFRQMLRRLRDRSVAAYPYADVPFSRLIEALKVERDTSRPPLVQTTIHLLDAELSDLKLPNLSIRTFPLDDQGARFEVTLAFWHQGNGTIEGFWEFNIDLCDRTSATRMADTYRLLVDAVIAHPDVPLSRLPMLPRSLAHQVLREWNDTAEAGAAVTLPQLLAAQVARRPDAPALVLAEGGSWSYSQLDARVNRLAHHLRALGVGPEVRVGLCLERGPRMLVALLAVLRAGGAYVPLDPTFPAERRAYMLADSGAPLLLTERALAGSFEVPAEVRVADLDADEAAIAGQPAAAPGLQLHPASLAYVIYTSGSTGHPKGVEVSHGALANFLHTMARRPGLGADDLLLAVTTISFDIAGLELYLPLACGARLRIAEREVAADGLRLAELLETSGATVMQATPATWRMLLDAGWQGHPAGSGHPLKLLSGGEGLPADLALRLRRRAAELWNVYGPTETTIWSTARRLDGDLAPGLAPIGQPIGNTRIYLLDRHDQPVPVTTPGLLHIAGDGVARGYHHRPALTAERFRPDPFAEQPGSRMYHTGDLARLRPSGDLEFLGRNDHQVKVRGFRIELGEIEALLGSHPQVREAAVVVRQGAAGNQLLVAYLALHDPSAATTEADQIAIEVEVRSYLKTRLPEYMIPSNVVLLEALPLTANGKVDRKALPAPAGTAAGSAAPEGEREERLAAIWAEVLKVDAVGAHDNFFRLGGDSILTIQVITRAQEVGLKLEPGQFFQYQTLRELAAIAEEIDPATAHALAAGDGFESGEGEDGFDDFGWSEEDFDAISDAIEESMD